MAFKTVSLFCCVLASGTLSLAASSYGIISVPSTIDIGRSSDISIVSCSSDTVVVRGDDASKIQSESILVYVDDNDLTPGLCSTNTSNSDNGCNNNVLFRKVVSIEMNESEETVLKTIFASFSEVFPNDMLLDGSEEMFIEPQLLDCQNGGSTIDDKEYENNDIPYKNVPNNHDGRKLYDGTVHGCENDFALFIYWTVGFMMVFSTLLPCFLCCTFPILVLTELFFLLPGTCPSGFILQFFEFFGSIYFNGNDPVNFPEETGEGDRRKLQKTRQQQQRKNHIQHSLLQERSSTHQKENDEESELRFPKNCEEWLATDTNGSFIYLDDRCNDSIRNRGDCFRRSNSINTNCHATFNFSTLFDLPYYPNSSDAEPSHTSAIDEVCCIHSYCYENSKFEKSTCDRHLYNAIRTDTCSHNVSTPTTSKPQTAEIMAPTLTTTFPLSHLVLSRNCYMVSILLYLHQKLLLSRPSSHAAASET